MNKPPLSTSSTSASQLSVTTTHDHVPKSAPSKIFGNLRRSLTPAKTWRADSSKDFDQGGIHLMCHAIACLMLAQHSRSQSRHLHEYNAARPTVEQIAMGLHLSRTPHIPLHLTSHTT